MSAAFVYSQSFKLSIQQFGTFISRFIFYFDESEIKHLKSEPSYCHQTVITKMTEWMNADLTAIISVSLSTQGSGFFLWPPDHKVTTLPLSKLHLLLNPFSKSFFFTIGLFGIAGLGLKVSSWLYSSLNT